MKYIKTCQYFGQSSVVCGCDDLHENTSYCAEHYAIVYQVGTGRATRHKDIRRANQIWDLQSELNAAIEELMAEGKL